MSRSPYDVGWDAGYNTGLDKGKRKANAEIARMRKREARVRALCAEQIVHAQSDFQASVYEDIIAILDDGKDG